MKNPLSRTPGTLLEHKHSESKVAQKLETAKPSDAHSRAHGALLKHWRNEVKISAKYVAEKLGMTVDHLKALEKGEAMPTHDELEKLAQMYVVSVRDLMPATYDLERGVKILWHKNARVIPQERDGRLQYTYWERVMTTTIPNFKPVELELHLHDRSLVVV